MAADSVEIVNSALHKLGAKRITSLSDSVKAAEIANDIYNRLRKEVLRSHPWNFAVKYVDLSATANTPVWDLEYTKEFLLPSDVLRVLETDLYEDQKWEIGTNVDNNKVIFCNVDTLAIKYIKDITDTTIFDANFDECLAYRLAMDMAYPLTQSRALSQDMRKAYKEMLGPAMSFDAQEKSPDVVEANQWIDERY